MKLNNKDPRYEKISQYVVITSVAIFVLYRLAAHFDDLLKMLGQSISWLIVVLTPVFWGFMLAYLLKPSIKFFETKLIESKRIKLKDPKKSRTLAVTITWVIILAAVTAIFSLILSALTKEFKIADIDSTVAMFESIAQSMQAFYNTLLARMNALSVNSDALTEWIDQIVTVFGTMINNFGSSIIDGASNATSFFTNLLLAIIFSIYFLADGENIRSYWTKVSHALLPKSFNDGFKVLTNDADIAFSGYIRGQLMDALFMAVSLSILLSLIGVKFAIVIGILAGIGNLIPYVGAFVAYILTALSCLATNDLSTMFASIICVLILQAVDAQIVEPKLLGSSVNIHPMYVIVAIIFGEAIGGFTGMIFAVPVAALIKIEFDRYITMKLNQKEKSN